MSKHPEILWAQRSNAVAHEKNIVFLTVNLPDVDESTLEYNLTPDGLSFKASAGSPQKHEYAFDLQLFEQVDPEKSSRRLTSRSLVVVLRKKESKSEYWPRLIKEKTKTPFIKTDFSKWADEDEQDESGKDLDEDMGDPGMGMGGGMGMGMGMGGGMGMGMEGGLEGMDFSKFMNQTKTADLNVTGGPELGANDADESDDDDGPPPLEEPENPK